jgi:SAM-dependent methyltransferase
LGATADADFWDRCWAEARLPDYVADVPARSLVVRETVRALERGSLILEGGCGLAANSWHLFRLGYRTLALDYAQATLRVVSNNVPEVRPLAGDVGRLPLPDSSVDGYWSLGVIEHFYGGYDSILDEMTRVVRPGGYLFLTFPAMSPLRRTKAAVGLYPHWSSEPAELDRFYQFALSHEEIAADFEKHGFRLERQRAYLGVSGLCEESGRVGRYLERALAGRGRLRRIARAVLDTAIRGLTYHVRLLVLRRHS